MWKRIKIIFKAIKDHIISMFNNTLNHVNEGFICIGWKVIPIIIGACYLMLLFPQLSVFASIASLTSGIQDPLLKFLTGIAVFSVMEFLLVTLLWPVVAILGLPEIIRFVTYIKSSYERRLMEEEIREAEGQEMTLANAYKRATDHGLSS